MYVYTTQYALSLSYNVHHHIFSTYKWENHIYIFLSISLFLSRHISVYLTYHYRYYNSSTAGRKTAGALSDTRTHRRTYVRTTWLTHVRDGAIWVEYIILTLSMHYYSYTCGISYITNMLVVVVLVQYSEHSRIEHSTQFFFFLVCYSCHIQYKYNATNISPLILTLWW